MGDGLRGEVAFDGGPEHRCEEGGDFRLLLAREADSPAAGQRDFREASQGSEGSRREGAIAIFSAGMAQKDSRPRTKPRGCPE